MVDLAHRRELAAFLRSRRERLQPADAGLQPGGRRRTPGLRREEIAQLSGVSLTWYTWLEQARDITVSRQVLETLARTLQLTSAETRHLLGLAGERLPPDEPLSATLLRMVEELEPNPAYLRSPCLDLLAWNRAEAAFIGDPATLPVHKRNVLWLTFVDPAMRYLLVDWAPQARRLLGQYRAAAGQHAGDPRFTELTTALREASPEFREWWELHDIAGFPPAHQLFEHPSAGRLSFDYVKLASDETPDVRLIAYLPADAETRRKLPLLVASAETAGVAQITA
jgi:transcriptional regulator with XRE-family HTH domain